MSRRGSSRAWHDVVARLPEFSRVPRWFAVAQAEHRLKPNEKLTFLSMCSLSMPDLMVESSQGDIAEHYGIAIRSVRDALPVLVERSFIVELDIIANKVRRYRISMAKPLPPAPAYPSNVRAIRDPNSGGWLARVEDI